MRLYRRARFSHLVTWHVSYTIAGSLMERDIRAYSAAEAIHACRHAAFLPRCYRVAVRGVHVDAPNGNLGPYRSI